MDHVVIINGYDLIWKDARIEVNDPHPFFFKEDPVSYLGKLDEEGWFIFLWWPEDIDLTQYPMVRIPAPKEFYDWLTSKRREITHLLNPVISASMVQQPGHDMTYYLDFTDYSSASFSIANREIYPGFANYTPFEIFGSVELPQNLTNVIYFMISNSTRNQDLLRAYFKMIQPISEDRNTRRQWLIHERKRRPNKQIVVVWSPVYNYDRYGDYIGYTHQFGRPDQDPPLPGVTYYTFGR